MDETLPDEAQIEPGFGIGKDGSRYAAVIAVYTGNHQRGQKVMEPLRKFSTRSEGKLGPTSYWDLQTMGDTGYGHGRQYYLKSGFLPQLTQGAIDAIVDSYEGEDLPDTWFQHLGGAVGRVAPDATAFSHRNVHSNYGISSAFDDVELSEQRIAAVRRIYAAVSPHMTGFYTNLNDDTEKKTWGNYGANYPRLAQIKKRYDPNNLFRLNANVKPA